MNVEFPVVPGIFKSPFYSALAVIPAGTTWVIVGGMNALDERGEVVGADSVLEQAAQVRKNLEAALGAAGCDWSNVVRVTVHLKAGTDPRQAFSVFEPALSQRAAPPLVGGYLVEALARPEFLLEVGLEAVK